MGRQRSASGLPRSPSHPGPPPGDLGRPGLRAPTQTRSRRSSLLALGAFRPSEQLQPYHPPKPDDIASESTVNGIDKFLSEAKAAYDRGVWQTDASHHARNKQVDPEELDGGTTVVQAKPGQRTLRMAYFFSGVKRKCSVGEHLKTLCEKQGLGLQIFEVDVLVGGSEHDLLDGPTQDKWIARLEDGEFDCILLSPPCGTWSRANWANDSGPKPCRNRRFPWGIPHQRRGQQRRATSGNEFIHFSIRAIKAAQTAKRKGFMVRCVLEHPEDLGRTHRGEPASIWQPEVGLREAFGDNLAVTVAGHQCQFPTGGQGEADSPVFRHHGDGRLRQGGVAHVRFSRLLPRASSSPLRSPPPPTDNRQEELGGFNTSPMAAYPSGMCAFLATRIVNDYNRQDFHDFQWGGCFSASMLFRPPLTAGQTTTSFEPSSRPKLGREHRLIFRRLHGQTDTAHTQLHERSAHSDGNSRPRRRSTRTSTKIGAYGPIKDGLTFIAKEALTDEEDSDREGTEAHPQQPDDDTSEEERELPGTRRPKTRRGMVGCRQTDPDATQGSSQSLRGRGRVWRHQVGGRRQPAAYRTTR